MSYLYFPFIIQGLLMGVDERLHQKRGLGVWERLGHPLDTLTVLIPLSLAVIGPYSEEKFKVFVALALFSCLFITKDEFVHTRECGGFENWLHSLLFVLHPLIFLCTAILWRSDSADAFLRVQPWVVGTFMIYQILRWSIPWRTPSK